MFAIQESQYVDFDVKIMILTELAAILNFKYVPLNERINKR